MNTDDLRQVSAFTRKSVMDRQLDHLSGLSAGLVADGKINQMEAETLHKWLINAAGAENNVLINPLLERTTDFLKDGTLDEDEAMDLLALLQKFAGGDYEIGEVTKTTELPLCDPAPVIESSGCAFCVSGTFAFGNRTDVSAKILQHGGSVSKGITQSTDYLILGTYVTSAWKHENFGRKIEKAMEYRQKYQRPHIVSEEHWLRSIQVL